MSKRSSRSRKNQNDEQCQQNLYNSGEDGTQTQPREHFIILRPSLAVEHGVNPALIMGQLFYLTRNRVYYDYIDDEEQVWFRRTYRDWQGTFPWLSLSSLRYLFRKLEREGIVQTHRGQNCKYYALTPTGIALFAKGDLMLKVTLEQTQEMLDELGLETTDFDRGVSENDRGECQKMASPHIYKDDSKDEGEEDSESPANANQGSVEALSPSSETFEDFLETMGDICSMNPKLPSHRKRLLPFAKELWKGGYRSADLLCVPRYWEYDDYRTGRIYPAQVVEIIAAAVKRYGVILIEEEEEPEEWIAPVAPPPTPPPDSVWQKACEEMRKFVQASTFAHRIRDLEWVSFEDGVLHLATRSTVAAKPDGCIRSAIALAYENQSGEVVREIKVVPLPG